MISYSSAQSYLVFSVLAQSMGTSQIWKSNTAHKTPRPSNNVNIIFKFYNSLDTWTCSKFHRPKGVVEGKQEKHGR